MSDFHAHLVSLITILDSYRTLCCDEPIVAYPHFHSHTPHELIDTLASLNEDEQIAVLQRERLARIKGSALDQLMASLADRVAMPSMTSSNPITHQLALGMPGKKQHEIERLLSLILDLHRTHPFSRVIDIGGGQGYLSSILAYSHHIPCICIDKDIDLIRKGEGHEAHRRRAHPSHSTGVQFRMHELGTSDFDLFPIMRGPSMSLGLHTCGGLSLHHIHATTEAQGENLINVGCCYNRLNPQTETNLSGVRSFPWTPEALTLASRAHARMGTREFQFKVRVKDYRYAIHQYLLHEHGLSQFLTLGNSSRSLYARDFESYALAQFPRLPELQSIQTDERKLRDFYGDRAMATQRQALIHAGFLRCLFGRPLELALLLDRAIWAEQQGWSVALKAIFNETISPRNIAMVAHRQI